MNESSAATFSRFSRLLPAVAAVVLVLVLAWGGYQWFFCRFYVPPGHMAIVTAQTGKNPSPGAILVEDGEKGIRREVLAEGRHFLDPFLYDVKIVPAIQIPLGKVGLVTSKVGAELPPGEIIAPDHQSKGLWRDVLGPGTYRLNPQGYQVEIVDAINIPVGYVGVVTSQTGKAPQPGTFAKLGEKGVLRDILQPGLYYINTRAYLVNVIEIGMNQVSMTGEGGSSLIAGRNDLSSFGNALQEMQLNTLSKQRSTRMKAALAANPQRAAVPPSPSVAKKGGGREIVADAVQLETAAEDLGNADANRVIYGISRYVEFPSRDGFKILIDMTVEFELMPEHISLLYLLYGDLPQVVENIILPQVLSISRLKGSSYKAQDFIMGEGRETFQKDLRNDLVKALAEKNIIVHNAIIRNVEIPVDILTPIRAVSIAREQNLTNLSLQETAKVQAELNTEQAMIQQRSKEVEQETRKLVAEIMANQKNSVEKLRAETALAVAGLQLKKSEIEARTVKLRGETDVKVNFLKENELANGAFLKSQVLGDLGILADLRFVEMLNPAVQTRIIHAGEGTLWTDLKQSSIALPLPTSRSVSPAASGSGPTSNLLPAPIPVPQPLPAPAPVKAENSGARSAFRPEASE